MRVPHQIYLIALVIIAIALVVGFGFSPLAFATITVCSSGCDNTSIQDAINVASAGDTINISAGEYAENVVVNVSVNLEGAGMEDTIVVAYDNSVPAINVTVNNVNITGLTVNNSTASSGSGIYLFYANLTNITSVNFSANYNNLYIYRSSNATAYDSKFYGALNNHVSNAQPSHNLTFRSNGFYTTNGYILSLGATNYAVIEGNYMNSSMGGGAISMDGINHTIRSNIIRYVGSSETPAMVLGASGKYFNDSLVYNNTLFECKGGFFFVTAGVGSIYRNTIANNTITKCHDSFNTYYPIGTQIGSANQFMFNDIENNSIANTTSGSSYVMNIGGANNTIRRNYITNVSHGNMYVINAQDQNATIENNTIELIGANVGSDFGIRAQSSYATIRYNTITSDQSSPVSSTIGIYPYKYSLIRGNTIIRMETGIYDDSYAGIEIKNNTLNNSAKGIQVPLGATIESNEIYQSSQSAIQIDSSAEAAPPAIQLNTFCYNNITFTNASDITIDNNTFCVEVSSPANDTLPGDITNFTLNVTNPVFFHNDGAGNINTSCQVYIDGSPIAAAVNNSIGNNEETVISYTPTGSPTSWFVACNDSATTNWGNSSTYYFTPVAAAAAPAATTTTTTTPSGVRSAANPELEVSSEKGVIDVVRGTPTELEITIDVRNLGNVLLNDISLRASGIPESWYSFYPEEFTSVRVSGTRFAVLTLDPPEDATTGQYPVEIFAGNSKVNDTDRITINVLFADSCPSACPEPSEWSDCIIGTQKRIDYACSRDTFYECIGTTQERVCGVGLPVSQVPVSVLALMFLVVFGGAMGVFAFLRISK